MFFIIQESASSKWILMSPKDYLKTWNDFNVIVIHDIPDQKFREVYRKTVISN